MKKIMFCLFLISGTTIASETSIEQLFPVEDLLRLDKELLPLQVEEFPSGLKIVVQKNKVSDDASERTEKTREKHRFDHQKTAPKLDKRDFCPPPPPPYHRPPKDMDSWDKRHRFPHSNFAFDGECNIDKEPRHMMEAPRKQYHGERILGILHKQTRLLERIATSLEKLLARKKHHVENRDKHPSFHTPCCSETQQ